MKKLIPLVLLALLLTTNCKKEIGEVYPEYYCWACLRTELNQYSTYKINISEPLYSSKRITFLSGKNYSSNGIKYDSINICNKNIYQIDRIQNTNYGNTSISKEYYIYKPAPELRFDSLFYTLSYTGCRQVDTCEFEILDVQEKVKVVH